MKKLVIPLCTIFFTILIMVSIYTLIPEKNSINSESNLSVGYTIADYCGKVAAFEDGSSEPFAVYDIYTHLLPENDIELLRKGIHVDDLNQLQSCLEDLGL